MITKRKFSVAPMLDWSDRHARYFWRLLSQYAYFYTEMVTTGALMYGDQPSHLNFSSQEHPIALQLGGSDPIHMAKCAKIGEDYGYDEININVGCPSDRVQSGAFGACLMAKPELVAECVIAMKQAVSIPITVKSRIGIDHQEDYQALFLFAKAQIEAGVDALIIHARKAWLQGLSPAENRSIPPLKYEYVYQLKKDFPKAEIIINGGITTLEQIHQHLQQVDGVMLGREVYHNPSILFSIDEVLYQQPSITKTRAVIIDQYIDYIKDRMRAGVRLQTLIKPMIGLFQGLPGGKRWRRALTEGSHQKGAGIEVIYQALDIVAQMEKQWEERQKIYGN